jgi:hypothetical protein
MWKHVQSLFGVPFRIPVLLGSHGMSDKKSPFPACNSKHAIVLSHTVVSSPNNTLMSWPFFPLALSTASHRTNEPYFAKARKNNIVKYSCYYCIVPQPPWPVGFRRISMRLADLAIR